MRYTAADKPESELLERRNGSSPVPTSGPSAAQHRDGGIRGLSSSTADRTKPTIGESNSASPISVALPPD
jgi:hypothetical protein